MPIVRRKVTSDFTNLDNKIIGDKRLSIDSLGVIVYLLSLPHDWIVRPSQLSDRFECGRDRIRRIINDLAGLGYIQKVQERDHQTGAWKAFEYVVTDSPVDLLTEKPSPAAQVVQRFWPAYPKREGDRGRPEAMKKFRAIVKSGEDAETIINAAIQYAAHWKPMVERKPAEAKFIPMASKWLHQRRWDDEQAAPSETAGGETMFDLANHFEQRVRGHDHDDGRDLIDGIGMTGAINQATQSGNPRSI